METYKDFQRFSTQCREDALKWLNGRTDRWEIVESMISMNKAANDNWIQDIGPLVIVHAFVMMLYCWVENDRDEVKAKLAYVEGRHYQPLP